MRTRFRASIVALLLLLPGCKSMIYKSTGDVMSSYATDHILPAEMASDDADMACETGVSFAAFLMSFGRVTRPPHRAGVVTYLSAGTCAEEDAWEAELRQMRALREKRSDEAQDARIVEKRAHQLAARRFGRAFELLQAEFGEVGNGCPKLEKEDELLYLLGLSSGLLAVMHDRAADGTAGVDTSIPPAVARGASCLDAKKWYGVPLALQAAIWASVPGAAPADRDPWAALAEAAHTGDETGVRLARAFQVQAAAAVGRNDLLREAITAHGKSLREKQAAKDLRMLDRLGTLMVEHESDKIWTDETGHRTPVGALGTFHQAGTPHVDDTLLEGLVEDKK